MSRHDKETKKTGFRPAGRYRYTQLYEMRSHVRADGKIIEKAEYTGAFLEAQHSQQLYDRCRISAITAAIEALTAGILLLIVKGFAVYQGGAYVFIPITLALFPSLYLMIGALKLPAEDRKLQLDVQQLAHERIRRSCIGITVLYGISLGLTGIFLFLNAPQLTRWDGLYLALETGTLLICMVLGRAMKKLSYQSMDGEEQA